MPASYACSPRRRGARSGSSPRPTSKPGSTACAARLAALAAAGCRHAILDATRDEHLVAAGAACLELPLATGGAGLALGLARALAPRARPGGGALVEAGAAGPGGVAVGQLFRGDARCRSPRCATPSPSFRLDPLALARDAEHAAGIAARAIAALGDKPVLVYATADPDAVAHAQRELGVERAATLVEGAFRRIAGALAAAGVRAFVVAGGETAGAVVDTLGVRALAIGPEIDPGVPWTLAVGGEAHRLALKSGNFGARDFFVKATRDAAMSDAALREALCRLGQSLYGRGLTHGSTGNLSVRTVDGYLMTPTGSNLGSLDPARLSQLDRAGQPRRRRPADEGSAAAPRDVRDAQPQRGGRPPALDPFGRGVGAGGRRSRRRAAAAIPPTT